MKKTKYDASSIDVNEGLDAVRANPQVYIGNPNDSGIFHILKEVIDNSIDEAIGGYGKKITILIDKTGYFWVVDEGRGIPIEIHKKTKISTLTTILTTLSAGGKMRKGKTSGYKNHSVGVHGMGISITNALSENLKIFTYRNNKWYFQEFIKGKPLEKIKTLSLKPKLNILKFNNKGTIIGFKPDYSMFDKGSELNINKLKQFLNLSAYLNAKIKFILLYKNKEILYHQPKGIVDLVKHNIEKLDAEVEGKLFVYQSKNIDIALQWSNAIDDNMESYVNGSNTIDGGTHIQGLYKALVESIRKYKTAKQEFRSEDIREGLVGIINYKISQARFASQTKTKLISTEALNDIYKELLPQLNKFFNSNKTLAKRIIKRGTDIRKAHERLQISKKAAGELKIKKAGKTYLPDKLRICSSKIPSKRELFLLEGESAGGTASYARDKNTQEFLTLKGKILNVYKDDHGSKTLNNKEIIDILKSIGYDPSLKNPLSKLRVGKIILLSDADPDGQHINILLLSLLHKIIPECIEKNMVYAVDSNLYVYSDNKIKVFGKNLNELKKKIGKNINMNNVTRLKGWGEATQDQLHDMAFSTKTRNLIRININKDKNSNEFINLVGKDTSVRQKLLNL